MLWKNQFANTNGWLTCNIITSYRPGFLTTILKQCQGYFDLIRIINGNPSDERMTRLLNRFDVRIINNKWNCNTNKFFKPLVDDASEGEWFFWLCDDELPDISLLEHLWDIIDKCENESFTSVMIPFLVIQDYIPQNTIPEFIGQARADELDNPKIFSPKFRCERLVKMYKGLTMSGPTHMGWAEPNKLKRTITEYPILHLKEDDGFLIGNLWPSVINFSGHGLNEVEGIALQQACKKSNIVGDEKIILNQFRLGKIHQSLKEWMWKHKDEIHSASWSWFAIYYFKYHPEELPMDFDYLQDAAFREWVRFMAGHEGGTRYIERTKLHPLLKTKLLEFGFESCGEMPQDNSKRLENKSFWRKFQGRLYNECV